MKMSSLFRWVAIWGLPEKVLAAAKLLSGMPRYAALNYYHMRRPRGWRGWRSVSISLGVHGAGLMNHRFKAPDISARETLWVRVCLIHPVGSTAMRVPLTLRYLRGTMEGRSSHGYRDRLVHSFHHCGFVCPVQRSSNGSRPETHSCMQVSRLTASRGSLALRHSQLA